MYTVKEVAEQLRVSTKCVYQLIGQGKIASVRIGLGRGSIRVCDADLATFVDGCRREERPDRPASRPQCKPCGPFKHLKIEPPSD